MKGLFNATSGHYLPESAQTISAPWLSLAQIIMTAPMIQYCSAAFLFQSVRYLQDTGWLQCPSFLGFNDSSQSTMVQNHSLSLKEAVFYGDCKIVKKILSNDSRFLDGETVAKAFLIAVRNGYLDNSIGHINAAGLLTGGLIASMLSKTA